MGQTTRTAVDSEVDLRIMLIVCNLRAFLNTEIPRVAVDYFIIVPKQCGSLRNVVLIGCGDSNCVNQSAAGIHTDVAKAQRHMASAVERTHQPHPERVAEYERLYQRYLAWGAAAEPLYNRGVPA